MWSNSDDELNKGTDKPYRLTKKHAVRLLYVLFFLLIASSVWRGAINARGYDHYPEIISSSKHLDRGEAKIAHKESIMKGTAAWLGNLVESENPSDKMFEIYTMNLHNSKWQLVYRERQKLIFCKGEIKLKIRYLGTSAQSQNGKSHYQYSEDFQWPDWEGYCKRH